MWRKDRRRRSRPRGERAQLSPIGSGPARVSGPCRARASRTKRRVGSRVGSFENAARSRVVRPIRGSTLTARPTANKYREGKLKRTLKRESKRTRNRPKEKKPRGRAGVRPGRSVAGVVFSRRRADRRRPVAGEGRDRFDPVRGRSATKLPCPSGPGAARASEISVGSGRRALDESSSLRLIRLGPWRPVLKHGPRSLTHARAKSNDGSLDAKRRRAKREAALRRRRGRAGSKVGSRTVVPSGARQSAALTEVHLQGPERW